MNNSGLISRNANVDCWPGPLFLPWEDAIFFFKWGSWTLVFSFLPGGTLNLTPILKKARNLSWDFCRPHLEFNFHGGWQESESIEIRRVQCWNVSSKESHFRPRSSTCEKWWWLNLRNENETLQRRWANYLAFLSQNNKNFWILQRSRTRMK